MSKDIRREMFRKFERVDGNLENAQDHLLWIINLHLTDKTLEQVMELKNSGNLTKENHRYANQLNLLIDQMTMIEMLRVGNQTTEEIFRKL